MRTLIMSGDRRESVRSVAQRIGIAESDVYAELRPEDKQRLVGELREQNAVVAMVGTLQVAACEVFQKPAVPCSGMFGLH